MESLTRGLWARVLWLARMLVPLFEGVALLVVFVHAWPTVIESAGASSWGPVIVILGTLSFALRHGWRGMAEVLQERLEGSGGVFRRNDRSSEESAVDG